MTRIVRASERGAFQILALSAFTLISIFVVALLSTVGVEHQGVALEEDRIQAFTMAEGAIDVAAEELVSRVSNFEPFDAAPFDAPFQVLSGEITRRGIDGRWTVTHATSQGSGAPTLVAPRNEIDATTGLREVIESFVIRAEATVGRRTARVVRHVELHKAPIFQFMAFYAEEIEVHPGPQMTLDGRVHSNGNIYFGAGTSMLVDTNYFRAAGDMFRHRKGAGSAQNGWIRIKNQQTGEMVLLPSRENLLAQGISSQSGLDSHFTGWDLNNDQRFDLLGEMSPFKDQADQLFGGTVRTSEHGVTPIGHPEVGSIQPYVAKEGGSYIQDPSTPGGFVAVAPGSGTHAPGFFHENARLSIVDDHVFNANGVDITSQMPSGFLTERQIYDAREGGYVTVTELNLARLGDMDGNPNTLDPSPHYPQNGLIYATRTDAGASSANGILVTNASELNVPDIWNSTNYGANGPYAGQTPPPGAYTFGPAEAQGLTVVSATPIYVQGDYNTKSKKPAAVIADTVNLLSNAWNHSKTPGHLPNATETTYNLAVITGNRVSTAANYNGGFENLPRFHENWQGVNCNIKGSFVNLWESQIATGNWSYGGDRYTAPNRNWSYEADFDTGELPPFTPWAIDIKTVAWETNR